MAEWQNMIKRVNISALILQSLLPPPFSLHGLILIVVATSKMMWLSYNIFFLATDDGAEFFAFEKRAAVNRGLFITLQ